MEAPDWYVYTSWILHPHESIPLRDSKHCGRLESGTGGQPQGFTQAGFSQDPQIIQLPTPTVQHCLIVRGWDASLRESKSVYPRITPFY